MHSGICIRLGLIAGAAVGLFINLLTTPACCGSQAPLSITQTVVYGMLTAFVVNIIAAAFACLLSRRPNTVLITIALVIALLVGALLGPVAYALPHPSVAMFVCAILGALLGYLLCWLLCRERFARGLR
jgi:membrane associated rhomboid family serine protease